MTRHSRRFRPALERLEDRRLLSISFSGPGNSGIASLAGAAGADQFLIRLKPGDATTIEFSDNGGSGFVDAALAGITGVSVTGLQGNDTLTLDASGGLTAAAGGLPISFDGGGGHDVLRLVGAPGGTVTETFTAGATPGAGTLALGNGTASGTITLTNVSAIQDTMTADTLTINGNDDANVFHLRVGPDLNGVKTDSLQLRNVGDVADNVDNNVQGPGDESDPEGDDSFGNLLSYSFANKAHVVLNGAGGNDLFLITAAKPAAGLQTLALDGGAGTNVLAANRLPNGVTVTPSNFQIQKSDADAIFIEQLYLTRLQRPAGDDEVGGWMTVLNGQGRGAVVRGVEESAEARTEVVKSWYARYLGRAAAGGEEQGWVHQLLQGDTEEHVLATILATPAFYNRAQALVSSGTPDERWVQAMYQLLLGRPAPAADVDGWVSQIPTLGRAGVAFQFLESNEFRADMITAFYGAFLSRSPDAGGLGGWVTSGIDLMHVREGFAASDEFHSGD